MKNYSVLNKLNLKLGAYHVRRFFEIGLENQDEKVYGVDFSLDYQRKRSNYHFGTYYENRNSEQITEDGTDYGVDLYWRHKLLKRMNATTSLRWNSSVFDNSRRDYDTWYFEWRLNRQLSRTLSGDLSLSHQKRVSDIQTTEFQENTIFVNLNKRFR